MHTLFPFGILLLLLVFADALKCPNERQLISVELDRGADAHQMAENTDMQLFAPQGALVDATETTQTVLFERCVSPREERNEEYDRLPFGVAESPLQRLKRIRPLHRRKEEKVHNNIFRSGGLGSLWWREAVKAPLLGIVDGNSVTVSVRTHLPVFHAP